MACHWEWLAARHQRKNAPLPVSLDPASGFLWWLARVLVRLDATERITFCAGGAGGIRVGNATGAQALFRVTRILPLGRLLTPLSRVMSLGGLDLVVRLAFHYDARVSRFFGLAAPPIEALASPREASVVRRKLGRALFVLHETAIVYLAICAASQVINENKSIPKQLKHTAPKFMAATVGYPRLFQGWGMFAPNPIREDGIMAVDAITIDGRHIDPFTGEAPDLNLSDARGTGFDQIEQDYFNRIRLDRNKTFRGQMERWITGYHEETGRPEDEIVFFNAYWLRDKNPDPGGIMPSEHELLCLHSYKKRRYRPEPPLPPLPQKCKVVSADKDKLHEKEKEENEEDEDDRSWWDRALSF